MIETAKLERAIDEGRMPHACFFCSADNSAAEGLSRRLAARFCAVTPEALAQCPDYFEPEVPLRTEPLRVLLDELMKASFLGAGHAVLFRQAHTMDARLQNVLLKTLEEPPNNTLFLLTGNAAAMLPTVRSRCAMLRMGLTAQADIVSALLAMGADRQEATRYAAMGGGLLEQALQLFMDADYRALREKSFSLFLALLTEKPPFEEARALAKDKQAAALARFWLSFSRDLLHLTLGMQPKENPDLAMRMAPLARRFTSGAINCMIDAIMNTIQRLSSNAPQGAVLDRLFTDILEVIK